MGSLHGCCSQRVFFSKFYVNNYWITFARSNQMSWKFIYLLRVHNWSVWHRVKPLCEPHVPYHPFRLIRCIFRYSWFKSQNIFTNCYKQIPKLFLHQIQALSDLITCFQTMIYMSGLNFLYYNYKLEAIFTHFKIKWVYKRQFLLLLDKHSRFWISIFKSTF